MEYSIVFCETENLFAVIVENNWPEVYVMDHGMQSDQVLAYVFFFAHCYTTIYVNATQWSCKVSICVDIRLYNEQTHKTQ